MQYIISPTQLSIFLTIILMEFAFYVLWVFQWYIMNDIDSAVLLLIINDKIELKKELNKAIHFSEGDMK